MMYINDFKMNGAFASKEVQTQDLRGSYNEVAAENQAVGGRFCWQPSVACGKPLPCSKEKFIELLNSPNVKSICERIAALDPSLEGYSNAKDSLKKQLPIVIFQSCRFKGDGRRCNENAVPSGLGMLDIDHVQNPKVIYDVKIAPKVDSNGIWFVAITPSGQGLRIVFELLENESIVQGQRRIAQVCGLDAYDEAVKDMARASFIMPIKNVLLIRNELFMNNMIHDVPMVCVPEGTRHTTGMDALSRLRREYEKAAEKVVSPLNIPYSEKNSMITWNSKKLLESASSKIEGTESEDVLIGNTDPWWGDYKKMVPPMEILPRVFQICCSKVKTPFRPIMISALLPLLGTLATKVRFEYKPFPLQHGKTHSLSFESLIVGESGSGKSIYNGTIELLAKPLRDIDNIQWSITREYNKQKEQCKNSTKQPLNPEVCKRYHSGGVLTKAVLMDDVAYSNDAHIFYTTTELDSIANNMLTSYGLDSEMFRFAFDNDEYEYNSKSSQTVSGIYKLYVNLLFSGTYDQLRRFHRNAENGAARRFLYGIMPDQRFTEIEEEPYYLSEEEAELQYYARYLMDCEGVIESQEVRKAIGIWLENTRVMALKTQNDVVDQLRKRSAVIGFRAGMLAYLLEGKYDIPSVGEFAKWVASYCLATQIQLFGKQIEEENSRINKGGYYKMVEPSSPKRCRIISGVIDEERPD